MGSSLFLAVTLVASSVLAVVAVLLLAVALPFGRTGRAARSARPAAIFLVAPGAVLDANRRGNALLDALGARLSGGDGSGVDADAQAGAWLALLNHLHPVFPDAAERLDAVLQRHDPGTAGRIGAPVQETVLLAADASGLRLSILPTGTGRARLYLSEAVGEPGQKADGDTVLVDSLSWQALRAENALLQRNVDLGPVPVWREDAAGRVIWANAAYMRLLHEVGAGQTASWPLPAIFPQPKPGDALRHGLRPGSRNRQIWFDLVAVRDGDALLCHALPADEAQRAERTRLEFVHTLSRTFATLPIGLAVFDRTRRLNLFNPALTDLTRLEPEFLASRPGLDGFLNRMRDKRILPEPRDYKAWSRRLLDVEAALASGGFEETWTLPDGRNFRVSAAPHPDGALALLIEDITDDVRLKRSFRVELETGQAALDMAESAIAVFAQNGELVLTNAAFDDFITFDGIATLGGVRLPEAITSWRRMSDEPGLWDRIAALSQGGGATAEVQGVARFDEGEPMEIRARLCPTGGVTIGFQRQGRMARPRPPRLSERLRQQASA